MHGGICMPALHCVAEHVCRGPSEQPLRHFASCTCIMGAPASTGAWGSSCRLLAAKPSRVRWVALSRLCGMGSSSSRQSCSSHASRDVLPPSMAARAALQLPPGTSQEQRPKCRRDASGAPPLPSPACSASKGRAQNSRDSRVNGGKLAGCRAASSSRSEGRCTMPTIVSRWSPKVTRSSWAPATCKPAIVTTPPELRSRRVQGRCTSRHSEAAWLQPCTSRRRLARTWLESDRRRSQASPTFNGAIWSSKSNSCLGSCRAMPYLASPAGNWQGSGRTTGPRPAQVS